MRKRRGRGEGSITQRSDGRWMGSLSLGYDQHGKRKRRYVYGATKQAVQQQIAKLQADDFNGMLSDSTNLKTVDFFTRWLEDSAKPTIRASTYDTYEAAIRLHINTRIGGTQLRKLTPGHITGLLADLERNGKSLHTRVRVFAVLHRAFDQAVKWGLMPRNICDAVDKPKAPRSEVTAWNEVEAATFLKEAEGNRLHALYVLALTTGLRQGEMLGLKWGDIDLKEGSLSVRRTLLERKGKHAFGEPKTAKGRRKVDLPKMAVEALKQHRVKMMAEGHRASQLVFCDTEGNPLRKSNLTRRSFQKLMEDAEVPRIRFHDLRHTAATLLLSQGVHPKVVQERLGHSQISVTLDTYSHVLPTMQRDAADKLDTLLGAKS